MSDDIIEITTPLRPAYKPDRIIGREDEQDALHASVNPEANELSNIYVHGPRGTGKTLLVKQLISNLPDKIRTCYVSCIQSNTHYKVLKRLHHALSGNQAEDGYHTSDLQRHIEQFLTHTPTVLILDDVDFLLLNDGEDLLYFLSRLENAGQVGIVLLSSQETSLKSQLEERTFSSLYPQSISFEPYTGETIRQILSERVEQALTPRSLHTEALEYIASSTQNVTLGLHWLEAAAGIADSVISETDVVDASEAAYNSFVANSLAQFSTHHQHLYQVIQSCADAGKDVTSGTIYDQYKQHSQSTSQKTVGKRSLSDYLKHLEILDLIHAEYHYGGKEGKTRNIRLKQPI